MKDNFKKGIVLIFALLFSALIFAQDDSTDLSFYYVEPVFENTDDSIFYAGYEVGSFWLDFELTDTTIQTIWVELLRASDLFGSEMLWQQVYTREEFEAGTWYDNGSVHKDIGILGLESVYLINMRLEDAEGLLITTLTKMMEQ